MQVVKFEAQKRAKDMQNLTRLQISSNFDHKHLWKESKIENLSFSQKFLPCLAKKFGV